MQEFCCYFVGQRFAVAPSPLSLTVMIHKLEHEHPRTTYYADVWNCQWHRIFRTKNLHVRNNLASLSDLFMVPHVRHKELMVVILAADIGKGETIVNRRVIRYTEVTI